jgi:hypothetical protein
MTDVCLDLREQVARSDHMLASHDRRPSFDGPEKLAHIDRVLAERILADLERKGQEYGPAPWLVMITSMGMGAAFFAAGMACANFFG